jgi:hypothetical protein
MVKNFFVLKGDTVEIYLTQGKTTSVDFVDWLNICDSRWYCREGYAVHSRTKYKLHRVLTGYTLTDHKNRDSLDNRRENLREANPHQNSANVSKHPNATSRWKGVAFNASKKRWKASICVNYHRIALGSCLDESDAAMIWNESASEHFGEFAFLNDHPLNHI